jgi:hypothetical protein|tara:strand:- start:6323 stop:6880 length:558 start_codon:yes stop_codon:yes gene_type:complete
MFVDSADGAEDSVAKSAAPKKTKGEDDEPLETVKLGGLRSSMQRNRNVEKKATDDTVVKVVNAELAKLDVAKATEILKLYSEKLEDDKRGSLAAFFADPIVALEADQVSITVGSKIVENEIMAEQNKLVRYFSEQGYALSSLFCIVNAKAVSEYKIFTPKQQFEAMIKEVPILEDFASRFNLELE